MDFQVDQSVLLQPGGPFHLPGLVDPSHCVIEKYGQLQVLRWYKCLFCEEKIVAVAGMIIFLHAKVQAFTVNFMWWCYTYSRVYLFYILQVQISLTVAGRMYVWFNNLFFSAPQPQRTDQAENCAVIRKWPGLGISLQCFCRSIWGHRIFSSVMSVPFFGCVRMFIVYQIDLYQQSFVVVVPLVVLFVAMIPAGTIATKSTTHS